VQETYTSALPLENTERCTYTRGADQRAENLACETWESGQFVYSNATSYDYDANNNQLGYTRRTWDPIDGYKDEFRQTNELDGNGNILSQVQERLDETSGNWVTEAIYTYTYSATNKVLQRTSLQTVNGITYGFRTTNTYDASDRLLSFIYEGLSGNTWVNQQKTVNTYTDADEREDANLIATWDATFNTWTENGRMTFTHTDLQSVGINESLFFTGWTITGRSTTNRNSSGRWLSNSYERYDTNTQTYTLDNSIEFVYNADESLHNFKMFRTDFGSGVYFQSLNADYDYGTYTGTSTPTLDAEVTVGPNPTHDLLQVRLSAVDATTPTVYTLIDAKGHPVAQRKSTGNQAQFNLADYPAGLYFLSIVQAGAQKVVPVVKN
jgi:hypothetical protein